MDLHCVAGPDSFQLSYRCEYRSEVIAYESQIELTSSADGRIVVAMRGVARSDFLRNRIGLCVHHDQGLAGAWVRVTRADGSTDETRFPVVIAPHQPFLQVAALTVRTRPGREVTTRFVGEVFETEDQRNWGDASFKTYGTPLARPFPVLVAAGETIEQRVELSVTGPGLALAAEFTEVADVTLLRACGISRLRAVITPESDLAPLRRSVLPLDLVLQGPPATWPDVTGLRLASVATVPADGTTTPAAWVAHLRERCPGVAVGGGNALQFTELNRQRPLGEGWDVLDIPIDPYVHADDLHSLFANVPAIAAISASAAALMPGAAIHLALAHGRHHRLAGRHSTEAGGRWLTEAIAAAAAAGATQLSLGPLAHLLTTDGTLTPAGRFLAHAQTGRC